MIALQWCKRGYKSIEDVVDAEKKMDAAVIYPGLPSGWVRPPPCLPPPPPPRRMYPSRGIFPTEEEEEINIKKKHILVCNKRMCVDTEVIRFCHVFDCFEGIVSAPRGYQHTSTISIMAEDKKIMITMLNKKLFKKKTDECIEMERQESFLICHEQNVRQSRGWPQLKLTWKFINYYCCLLLFVMSVAK